MPSAVDLGLTMRVYAPPADGPVCQDGSPAHRGAERSRECLWRSFSSAMDNPNGPATA